MNVIDVREYLMKYEVITPRKENVRITFLNISLPPTHKACKDSTQITNQSLTSIFISRKS